MLGCEGKWEKMMLIPWSQRTFWQGHPSLNHCSATGILCDLTEVRHSRIWCPFDSTWRKICVLQPCRWIWMLIFQHREDTLILQWENIRELFLLQGFWVSLQGRQCICQDVHLMVFLSFRHSICCSRWHLCSLKDHKEQALWPQVCFPGSWGGRNVHELVP